MSTEQWKLLPDNSGYAVSSLGRVRSRLGRILRSAAPPDRYFMVTVCVNGVKRSVSVHRLVASMFVSGYAPEYNVNHIDGNRHNNCAENLEWVSQKDNIAHARNTLLRSRGGRKPGPAKGYTLKGGRYEVRITVNYKLIYIGRYLTEKAARKAYALACKQYTRKKASP